MNLRSTWLPVSLVLVTGCGLVYDYTGYHPGTGSAATGGTSGTMSSSAGTTSSSSAGTGGTGGTGTTSTTTSTTSSTTMSSTSSGCTGGDMCVSVPSGWSGPIALETGSSPPSCGETGWGTSVSAVEGGTGTIVPPAGCGSCTCGGSPSGGSCPGSATLTEHGNGCVSVTNSDTVTTTCGTTFIQTNAVSVSTTSATGASCNGSTPNPTSPPSFPTHVQGCSSSSSPPSCTGGVCVPPPNHLCVYAVGQSVCPSGFPNQTEMYTGIMNNYSCTQCSCTAVGVTCQPTVSFYTDTICGAFEGTAAGTCTAFGDPVSSARITDTGSPAGGSCAANGGGTLQGSATATGPVTVCCK